ncbi:hypothetical protein FALBO_16728 [Fusarium albosuccineum]|uniref:Mg2+ transporter n=1 Tax=Fusarium albosuccineum TaxID=1237068 RepID=A0A8H4KEY6_9HYPO|nr:hypothetical protein FALBO_16728 [Fusarium albosuccineum]
MASPPPPPEGHGRSSHVRFADEEYYVRPRRPYRQDSRNQSRRSTYERIEIPIERPRYRNDSGDRPAPRTAFRVDVPVTRTSPRPSRDEGPVDEDYYDWPAPESSPRPQPESDRKFTESPRPIEDDEDDRREPTRRHSSYDRVERSRSRSRSRSPYSYRYRSPRRDRYRSRETSTRGAGYDGEYYRSSRAPSYSSDEWEPYDKFSFASQSQSITESSKEGDSDVESPESEERVPPKEERGKPTRSQLTPVNSSLYTGNAEMGGSHTAILKVVHDPQLRKHPLFRWLHVPQDVMNFDELWVEVSRLSGLTELEKKAITRLRADVKKTCVRSRVNPKGAKVGYLEPRCIEVPLSALKQKTTSTDPVTGSARWISIPYFSLEQYSGLLAASSPSLFPAQTLLQVQYSRNTYSRDMEQAVRQLGNTERGECFHISQLWCLVIDNSLLVTCGTMTRDELLGQALEVKEQPSRAPAAEAQGRILVAYGESVVWSLEAEECQTWFAFLSKFQAFWPKVPEFWHKNQAITAKKWPNILKLAATVRSMSIKIIMKLGSQPEPPPRAVLRPEPQVLSTSHDGTIKPGMDELAHVLTLASGGVEGLRATTGLTSLKTQLAAAEKFLTVETTYSNRKAYKCCEVSTRTECYAYLTSLADRVEEDGSDKMRRTYEEKIDIFNAADIMYAFFLPMEFEGPMSGKFWGAVRKMIHLPMLDSAIIRPAADEISSDVRGTLRSFTQDLIAFQNIMAHSTEEERAGVELPSEFSTAWLYVVMGMIYGSINDFAWGNRISRAKDLVEKGSKKLLQSLSEKSLLDKAAVLPLEVFSLVTLGLLQDQVGKSDDICETYSQYLNSLDNAISSKPSDRQFQHHLDLVQQELIAVKRTLWKQKNIISRVRSSLTAIDTRDIVIRQHEQTMFLKDKEKQYTKRYYAEASPQPPPMPPPQSYGPDEDWARADYAPQVVYTQEITQPPPQPANDYMGLDNDFLYDMASSSKLSPTDAGGLRGLLFLDCSRLIEQREFEFRRFTEFTKDLERGFAYKMDFTRDRQERAIYAFTLVTIVFLPISTVSSIFGMNTTDVRDMEYSQWLYWVVAIPLTFLVILAGLWFMGELGNLIRWLTRRSGQGVQGVYGGPAMMPQAFESAYWAPSQMAPGAEYASPYAAGPGMQRTQAAAYYPSPSVRVYRSRSMGV